MKELDLRFKLIVLDVRLNGNKMNEKIKKDNFFNQFRSFIFSNLRLILITIGVLFISFISIQTYNFFKLDGLKKNSISFFNTLDSSNKILENLYKIKKDENIFSTLSTLKIIQKYNEENNFKNSIELYKELILSSDLDILYKSSIAAHASYTLINASYIQNNKEYFEDISIFISSISDDLDSYYSIKKELEYLLKVTEVELNKLNYKNNLKSIELYNEINNSDKILSSVKERVKKIHEFHLYN